MKKEDYIQKAQAAGSAAQTLHGALLFFRRHPGALDPGSGPRGGETPEQSHQRRLLERYSGLTRLPRYLSAQDRDLLERSTATRWARKMRTLKTWQRDQPEPIPGLAKKLRITIEPHQHLNLNALQEDAYYSADWGRLRKRYQGESADVAGIRSEDNGKWGWDKVSWHYADYKCIAPANHGLYFCALYTRPTGEQLLIAVSPHYVKISGAPIARPAKTPETPALPVHVQRRILALAARGSITVGYDREAKKLYFADGQEQYHTDTISSVSQAVSLFARALTAFRKRRAEKIDISKIDLQSVFVTFADSTDSGNCASMTEAEQRKIEKIAGATGPLGAVQAAWLLSLRDDSYTRRAIQYAASRRS